jgi:hypothetical protein
MPLIGSDARPTGGGWWEWWGSSNNRAAELFTMPERGRITHVGVWAAGAQNYSPLARVMVWRAADGAIIGQGPEFNLPKKTTATSASDCANNKIERLEYALEQPVEVDADQQIYLGFSRVAAGASYHQIALRPSSGTHFDARNTPWDTEPFAGGSHVNQFGAWAAYELVSGAWVRRGGVWVRADEVFVRRAGAWVPADTVAVRRGSGWVDAD